MSCTMNPGNSLILRTVNPGNRSLSLTMIFRFSCYPLDMATEEARGYLVSDGDAFGHIRQVVIERCRQGPPVVVLHSGFRGHYFADL